MTPKRLLPFAAIGIIIAGVTMVAAGEVRQRAGDQQFRSAQFALQASFGVFDDPAARDPLGTDDEQSSDARDATAVTDAVALLSIPKIDLDVAAVSYREYADLERAIGYMPESDAPNESGITYFVGHRTGFGAPFRDLDQLSPGDVFTVRNAAGIDIRYTVDFVEIRKPNDALPELLRLNGATNVLLVTCHPEFSTELRLIVGARGEDVG
jgi:LPXTG-site transpeptidase (sortase) family protein